MALRRNARGCVRDVTVNLSHIFGFSVCVCHITSGFAETLFRFIQLMNASSVLSCVLWVTKSYSSSAQKDRVPLQQCLTWKEMYCHLVHLYSTESSSLVIQVQNLNESC